MKKAGLLILAMVMTQVSFAKEVHKCVVKGSVTYQARPCAGSIPQSQQLQLQKKLSEKTVNQHIQKTVKVPSADSQYSQQQHLQRHVGNRTSNEIPDTAEGKKRSLALAQDAYNKTKNR